MFRQGPTAPLDIHGHLLRFDIWTPKTYRSNRRYDWMSRGYICFKRTPWGPSGCPSIIHCLEDGLPGRTQVVIGSPPCLSHEVRPFRRGPTTPGLGDLRSPELSTTYKSWDDPPSRWWFKSFFMFTLIWGDDPINYEPSYIYHKFKPFM